MNERKLLKIKKEISEASQKIEQLKGKKEILLETLKKDYKCSSLEEAADKIAEYAKEIDGMENKLKSAVLDLKEKYEFE